ncbi:MAG: hypothetical protein J0L88_09075, partial [Xanthomonadales bacterium]|nr:hypothetical protein [Xanthomonadales bacterium]
MLRIFLAAALLVPCLAHAEPAIQEQWYTVLLDGRKIGQFEDRREVRDGRVLSRQHMQIELDRAGTRVSLGSLESAEETLDGKPLAFTNETRMSGSGETRIVGLVEAGEVTVRNSNAGVENERRMAWPDGALLPEGLRLALLAARIEEGASFRNRAFQPATLEAVEVTSTVGPMEAVDLPGGRRQLRRIEQGFAFPGAVIRSTAWIDGEREVRKLSIPTLGIEMTLLECDQACATAPNQPADIFEHTLVRASRALRGEELANGLRYRFVPTTRDGRIELPATGEQRVAREGRTVIVEVRRQAGAA